MKRSVDAAFLVEHTPSSPESVHSAPSPAPSSSSSDCPPRKRSRSEMTTEERKEARAHRNRIAAQNSRDRRKVQFSYLERRVTELEEENRQLRAGMGMTGTPSVTDGRAEQLARDKAQEEENEELKERIRLLENGWDAVVKALAASGLPLNIPAPPSLSLPSPPPNTASSRASVVAPVTPITPPPSSPESSMFEFEDFENTRHLARVAITDAPLLSSVPQQRVNSKRISSNWSSAQPLPRQRLLRLSTLLRRRAPPSTRALWRTSSARFSRRLPPYRRHLSPQLSPPKRPPHHPPRRR